MKVFFGGPEESVILIKDIYVYIVLKNYKLKVKLQMQNVVKKNAYYFTLNDLDAIVNESYPKVEVKLLNDQAKTILISYKGYNPQKAADIVSKMTEEYSTFDIERKGESSIKVIEFIDQQIALVYERLKSSETSIQEFTKENNVSNTDIENTAKTTRLNALDDQIISLELEENVLNKIETTLNNSN